MWEANCFSQKVLGGRASRMIPIRHLFPVSPHPIPYSAPPATPQAEAHERLADAALLNEQPHRALEELHKARALLHALRDRKVLPHDDRHLADVDFSLGIAQLQAGDAAAAAAHYRQAVRILMLRQAKLQRQLVDAQIEKLSAEVHAAPGEGAAAADEAAEAANAGMEAEVASIGQITQEIEKRLGEIGAATTSHA